MSGTLNFWMIALFVVICTVVAFSFLWMVLLRNAIKSRHADVAKEAHAQPPEAGSR